jgi:two-component system nitrogen regulation response regulator NtrX
MILPDRVPLLCVGCLPKERPAIDHAISSLGFSALWARNQRHAQSVLSRGLNVVLLDLTRSDSLPMARAIRSQNPEVVMIGLARDSKRDRVADALREGVVEVVSKPIIASELDSAITLARRLRTPPQSPLLANIEAVFVRSAPMRTAVDLAWRAALTNSPTMIIGEPQTGREFLARTIHRVAGQDPNSFVKVDCAELRPADIEAQLFGLHRTTAWSSLHRALGGTLFLKHFAAMPAAGRATLARALRLRDVSVDGRGSIDQKIRIIVAAGPSAGDERACGDLSADIPFIRLHVPPLRQRPEDISLLANHFVEQISLARGVPLKVLTGTAHALLAALPWRGNAAELRSLLQELVVHVPGRVIRLEDVLPHLRLGFGSPIDEETLQDARSGFERDYIIGALERHGGRIGETARALGILRPNLHRKMRSLQIVRASAPAVIAHADVRPPKILQDGATHSQPTVLHRSAYD